MTRKNLALVALLMVLVFGGIVVFYPLLFNPNATPTGKVEVTQPTPAP